MRSLAGARSHSRTNRTSSAGLAGPGEVFAGGQGVWMLVAQDPPSLDADSGPAGAVWFVQGASDAPRLIDLAKLSFTSRTGSR
jgi:hypothetical protein